MTGKTLLVTGAGGFIGSHTILELLEAGYEVVAVDNFSNAIKGSGDGMPESLARVCALTGKTVQFYSANVLDNAAMNKVFSQHQIHCVLHFAALKAVGESLAVPLEYYEVNVGGTVNLLKIMLAHGVKNFIFSSSATVYGQPEKLPLIEDSRVGDNLTNPYGWSKFFVEIILKDLHRSDAAWNVLLLRYFNPVGAHPSGRIGEDPRGVPNNLMPYVSQVAVGKLPHVNVFGNDYDTVDGTGVRDYIHVVDCAKGHVAAVKKLFLENVGLKIYNLGTGRGYSVLEMIAAMKKASGKDIPHKLEGRRGGDVAAVYCDPGLAERELGWKTQYGLDEMCRDLWNWQSSNPNGFAQS